MSDPLQLDTIVFPPKGFPVEMARWVVLGLAMANRPFAERLSFEVGPYGFTTGGNGSRILYNAVEAGPPYDRAIKEVFGIEMKEGEKPSEVLVRELAKRGQEARYEEAFKPLVRRVLAGDFAGAMAIVHELAAKP